MKHLTLLLCLLWPPAMAEDAPPTPKQEPQLYFECGTMKGVGLLVLVDEDGSKALIPVACGVNV